MEYRNENYMTMNMNDFIDTIMDEDYMLSSEVLKSTYRIDKMEKSNLDSFMSFMANVFLKGIGFWVVFMLFALVMNGGIVVDLIILVLILITYAYGCANTSYVYTKMANLNAHKSFDAFENTMKEAKWLIPALEKCEKIGDLAERKVEYRKLVEKMDVLYGVNNHSLVAPINRDKKEEIKYIVEVCWSIGKEINKYYQTLYKYKIDLLSGFDASYEYYYLIDRQTEMASVNASVNVHGSPGLDKIHQIKERIFGTIDHRQVLEDNSNIGIEDLLDLQRDKLWMFETFDVEPFNYYTTKDITCLEGKLLYEKLSKVQYYYPGEITVLKELREIYDSLCEAVRQHGYTEKDLKEEIRKVRSMIKVPERWRVFNEWRK